MKSYYSGLASPGLWLLALALPLMPLPAAAQDWRWDDGRDWRDRRIERVQPYDETYPYYRRRWRDEERWQYLPRERDRRWSDEDDNASSDDDTTARPRRRPDFDRADTPRDDDAQGTSGKPEGADGGPRIAISPQAPPVVSFVGGAQYKPGSIVIDTSARKLYYVRNAMSAFAYPIGVGREGFAWTGREKISRMADWPDWYPPAEMRQRKPELPERMLGGLRNPLGAKAIYLGNTLYRIHGTNDPKSIGKAESSGCFRMMNEHVLHLASIVSIGTEVSVVRSLRDRFPAAVAVSRSATPQTTLRTQRQARPRIEWSPDPDPNAAYGEDDDPYYR